MIQKEEWEFDFQWLQLRHRIKELFTQEDLPSFNSILYLVGIQELGTIKKSFTKEEKQDIFHIAVCKLMSLDGFYTFKGLDDEGWPHYEINRQHQMQGAKLQERYLKEKLLQYFSTI